MQSFPSCQMPEYGLPWYMVESKIKSSFYEQTLKMAANDASGQGLQSAIKNKHQNIFLRKLQAFEVRCSQF